MEQQDQRQAASMTGYPHGNMEQWGQVLYTGIYALWDSIMKTIEPLIYASLLDLLGNDGAFHKFSGQITPVINKDQVLVGMSVQSTFEVPDFKGFDGKKEAVEHDRQIILAKLQASAQLARWDANSVKFDLQNGRVVFMYQVAAGGSQ